MEFGATRELERRSIAAAVCACLLSAGKTDGSFSMATATLSRKIMLPYDMVEAAVAWAIDNGWMCRRDDGVQLKATGIHMAKQTIEAMRKS